MSIHVPLEIKPHSEYRLWVRFPDGVAGEVDLSHLAGVGVFRRWKENPQSFRNVQIGEDGSVLWDGEFDLRADAIYLELAGKPIEEVFPRLVVEWAALHRAELIAAGDDAKQGRQPRPIAPLE